MRKPYPSDLSDAEWALIEPLVPPERPRGRHRTANLREVTNGILYVLHEGCTWRALPHDFPPRSTVYHYFERWSQDGTWGRIYEALHRRFRAHIGRDETASAGSMDSQSVKASELARESGHDYAKRTKGRKRHLMVDTEGFPIAVTVTVASANDKRGARTLLDQARTSAPSLKLVWADAGYEGEPLSQYAAHRGVRLEVSAKVERGRGFVVQARRWVVERSFAWLKRCRRLMRDVERLSRTVEDLIYLAFTRLLLRRITTPS